MDGHEENKPIRERTVPQIEGRARMAVRSKTCGYAIASLVLGGLSLLFWVLTGIPAVVVGIVSIIRITRGGGALKGKYIALAGVLISVLLMGTFYLLWSLDAPPIPDDYTLADIRSAPAQYAESFELLKTLIDEELDLPGAPAIGLTEDDIYMSAEIRGVLQKGTAPEISEILADYAEDISRAWANTEEARNVIGQLDAFAEIADLTEPSANVKIMRTSNLAQVARFYQVYAQMQTEQRDIRAFATELIELDSVYRKLSVNARLFITKMICFVCLREDIETANAIANNPEASRETVELLAKYFTPLTAEHMSLRNPVLFEYLVTKTLASDILGQSIAGRTPLLKRNSTLRLYRNSVDAWINSLGDTEGVAKSTLSVWPAIYGRMEPVSFDAERPLLLFYRCYNPIGSKFIRLGRLHSFRGTLARRTAMRIQDDLLQIVLNKRLGKEVSMKARAYSDEYIVDIENKKILSPGPDGKTDTKDDIELPINPEILGW